MNKKYIIYITMLALLIGVVFASNNLWCYQETANVSTSCGGLSTGAYSCGNESVWGVGASECKDTYDGDFGTFGSGANAGPDQPAVLYINYTKPITVTSPAYWVVKVHNVPTTNYSLSPCWQNSTIQLKIESKIVGPSSKYSNLSCWNNTAWQSINKSDSCADCGEAIYEEAIYWNVTNSTGINITFRDEVTNTLITGQSFTAYLERINFSSSFSGITNSSHVIEPLLARLYTQMKVSSGDYPEREYLNIDLRGGQINAPINYTVYLVNSSIGQEVKFTALDPSLAPIDDVTLDFVRIFNGSRATVAQEVTDFDGSATLYLDPNYEYEINVTRAGFADRQISLEPSDTLYFINLERETDIQNFSFGTGITYNFGPSHRVLSNNTIYNFTFNLNSSYWDITNCTLFLYNETGIIKQNSSDFTNRYCNITILEDTKNNTFVRTIALYVLNGTHSVSVNDQYTILYTYVGEFSLRNFLDDLSNFGEAGFNSFTRMLIALIVIIIVTAMAARFVGFDNTVGLLGIVWALLGLFSYINWFNLNIQAIPDIGGLRQYIIFYLMSILIAGYLIERFMR